MLPMPTVVVAAGQQRLARRRARGRRVEAVEAQPALRQPFGRRRTARSAERAAGTEADVVEEDDQHVRCISRRPQRLDRWVGGLRVLGVVTSSIRRQVDPGSATCRERAGPGSSGSSVDVTAMVALAPSGTSPATGERTADVDSRTLGSARRYVRNSVPAGLRDISVSCSDCLVSSPSKTRRPLPATAGATASSSTSTSPARTSVPAGNAAVDPDVATGLALEVLDVLGGRRAHRSGVRP